jgi:hypothetical protein
MDRLVPQKIQKSNEGSTTSSNRCGDKRDPGTPDTDKGKSSTSQQKKKDRRVMKADTVAKEKKDLGMFYLKNPKISPSDMFPKDMPEKICANFTCKGKECVNANCDFTHPRKASKLKRETILAIASHFDKKDIGWFNEYHFMKMPEMTAGVKRLLGNTKGVISSGLNSSPKVVRPILTAPVSFDQALSNKLHSTLVIQPTASKKVTIETPVCKQATTSKSFDQSSLRPIAMEKQHAIVPGLVTDNKDVTTIASPQQDSIIIRGTKEKKRILSDYQEKFGANYPDSIITQKKGKLCEDEVSLTRS